MLDTDWPKSAGLQDALAAALAAQGDSAALVERLFAALADRAPAPDALLPQTGVGLESERQLSPRMIVAPHYGTRSATIVLIDCDGNIEVAERSFDAAGNITGEVRQAIQP